MRGILAEREIDLLSVDTAPIDLGYETGKFIVTGKRADTAELPAWLNEAVTGVQVMSGTPLAELDPASELPFVLKRNGPDSGGVNKYLINRRSQVAQLQKYLKGELNFFDLLAEPYIQSPGETNSSYRVVVTATGDIIASSLFYRSREGQKAVADFNNRTAPVVNKSSSYRSNTEGWLLFADVQSEYFLDADDITSNVRGGGRIIPLRVDGQIGSQPELSAQDRQVLADHEIEELETPTAILESAKRVGRVVGPKLALQLGIDFIQGRDGTVYLLEANPYPGLESILTWWGLNTSGIRHYGPKQQRASDDVLRVVADKLALLRTASS
jgi:hypothetical protein